MDQLTDVYFQLPCVERSELPVLLNPLLDFLPLARSTPACNVGGKGYGFSSECCFSHTPPVLNVMRFLFFAI